MAVAPPVGIPRATVRRWCAAAIVAATVGNVSAAPEGPAKPDWPGLEAAMLAGDYEAAAAAADAIATAVRPKPRDPDYLPRSVDLIRALMRGGAAALRLGRLDDAESAFGEAFKAFKDKEFQRLLNLQARQASATVRGQLAQLEVSWLELLALRMTVIVERMRALSTGHVPSDAIPAEQAEKDRADLSRWMDQFAVLKRLSGEARESFAERFGDGGPAIAGSPRAGAVVGGFSAAMIAGKLAHQRSRLPHEAASPAPDVSAATGIAQRDAAQATTQRLALLADALEDYRAAAAAYEDLVAAAAPKTGALKPEARIEAAALELDLLTNRGAALLDRGDVEGARKDFSRALHVQRELLTLRKAPAGNAHPDLLGPLLAVADAAIAGGRRRAADGDADGARGDFAEAEKQLAEAKAVAVAEGHPLHGLRAEIAARLDAQQQALQRSLPRTERADMAARRLRMAIDATAAEGP